MFIWHNWFNLNVHCASYALPIFTRHRVQLPHSMSTHFHPQSKHMWFLEMGQASACCPESNRRAWQPFGNHVAMLIHWHCALAWNCLSSSWCQINQVGKQSQSFKKSNDKCCKQALSSLLDHSYQNENMVSRRRLLVFPPRFFCLTFRHSEPCKNIFSQRCLQSQVPIWKLRFICSILFSA